MFVSKGGNPEQYIKSLENYDYHNFIKKKKLRVRKIQENLRTPNESPVHIDKTVNLSCKVSMKELDNILFDENIISEVLKPAHHNQGLYGIYKCDS